MRKEAQFKFVSKNVKGKKWVKKETGCIKYASLWSLEVDSLVLPVWYGWNSLSPN